MAFDFSVAFSATWLHSYTTKEKYPPMAPKFRGVLLDFTAPTQVTPTLNFTPQINTYVSKFQATTYYGDYTSDLAKGRYNKQWDSLIDMEIWLRKEQEMKFIELRLKDTIQGTVGDGWTQKSVYVCSCQGTGGKKKYEIKKPMYAERKVPSKRTGCKGRLTVKSYPNTEHVLGMYEKDQSHVVGEMNARFMRLPTETRVRIAEALRTGITHKRIVSVVFLLTSVRLLC